MVARGLAPTRSRARDVISRGLVRIGATTADKPALMVDEADEVRVSPEAGLEFVSRGALKLQAALDHFGFDAHGRIALDVGASTGGFTQLFLERGATRVYAVDVGSAQLHDSLRRDPRVVALENQDARTLTSLLVPQPVTALAADVSFISLSKVLPAAMAVAGAGAWLVALIKPQFEVGPERVGKGGIVREAAARRAAVDDIVAWLAAQPGWRVAGTMVSPIEGGSGNLEYLAGVVRDGR